MFKKRMTLIDIRKFQEYLEREEKAAATVEKYIRDVRKFYLFTGAGGRYDRQTVLAFKKYLTGQYLASSVNSMLAALNCFFEYQGLGRFKVRQLRIQKQIFCPEEKELTKNEYNRLLAAAKKRDQRLYLMLQTICGTGIRVSELASFTVAELRAGRVQVRCKNKSRIVWIPGKLAEQLLSYAHQRGIKSGPIFVIGSGRPIDRSNIWKQMKALSHPAAVAPEKIFPHNLRHLFARVYYEREKDIVKLADILGHTGIETTRIYTVSTGRVHARQIEKLGLVSGTVRT